MTHYQILHIQNNASTEEIRAAYRSKAFEVHPDRNKSPDAHFQFIRVREAYEILSDSRRRLKYNASLAETQSSINTNFPDAAEKAETIYYDPIEAILKIFFMSWKDIRTMPPPIVLKKIVITFILRILFLVIGLILGIGISALLVRVGPVGVKLDADRFYLLLKICVPPFALLGFIFAKRMLR